MNDRRTTKAASSPVLPNPEQRAVIEARADEWLLVVAGPGTGKTQVAAMRLANLLRQGLQPAQILVLSFSRSAVATLTRRLSELVLDDDGLVEDLRHLAIRTFDSWAFRMLRQEGTPIGELLSHSHDANIALVTESLRSDRSTLVDRLATIRHVIVDEFQDLPGVRAEMVTALLSRLNAQDDRRVGFTVLGDPVQAIYRFAARGQGDAAPSDPWADLRQRMGSGMREISLTRNHRATSELADMAASLRKILGSRDLDPGRKLAAMTRFLERLPASRTDAKLDETWLSQLPTGSLAILTRTNGEALQVWKMLLGKSLAGPPVPVRMRLVGTTPAVPAWIAALLSRYRFPTITRSVVDKAHERTFEQLGDKTCWDIDLPGAETCWRRLARASGASDMATVIDLDMLRERLGWPDAFPDDQANDEAAVYITTVHQAKGMEFDNVALLEERERRNGDAQEDPLEAANVGFVAVTRAGRHLGRLPATCIHGPPTKKDFSHGRVRQVHWRQWVNMQMGLQGDVDPTSFVDGAVLGGEAEVAILQDELFRNASTWRGHKVVLRQVADGDWSGRARDVRYEVRLQTEDGEGRLLCRTSQQLTQDLLDLLWKPGYSLPRVIYNLRISDLVSISANGDLPDTVPDPWRSSRLWVGVSLVGTGDFKTWRRRGS